MKKVIISAAIALFAVSAFAQTRSASNGQGTSVSSTSKETTLEGKEKGQAISELAKSKSNNDYRQDDLNRDGKLSREEREARRAARKADVEARRADRADDGILNGSAGDYNTHGKDVSGVATGTMLEGREKGEAVSDVARSKARNGERAQATGSRKPNNVGRPSAPGKSSGAGRSAGTGRRGNK